MTTLLDAFFGVFEGSIDAIMLGGIAVLTNEISPEQALQITQLGKQVIVVPDQDKPGIRMAEQAIELGWSVSFPNWAEDIKDAGEAINRYGRLATMISILKNVETTELKSKLRMKIAKKLSESKELAIDDPNNNRAYKGKIQQLFIFDRIINQDEISILYYDQTSSNFKITTKTDVLFARALAKVKS